MTNKPEFIELCGREGPGCDGEVVCRYKPKRLHTQGEKAFADAQQQSRQFFQNEPPMDSDVGSPADGLPDVLATSEPERYGSLSGPYSSTPAFVGQATRLPFREPK